MENKKIDITSSAFEKGIDLAKSFLDKLIMPSIEETGLLLKDKISLWKFKNQVKMLNSAKAYCEKNKISPKTISLKLLCPLLEYSGFEEEEVLQDKWAILLSNMVDSEQNIENHVFPYILSQLSSNEFLILEKVLEEKQKRVEIMTEELNQFKAGKILTEIGLNSQLKELEDKIQQIKESGTSNVFQATWDLEKQKGSLLAKLSSIKYKESSILRQIARPEEIPLHCLKEFEMSNLIRLGLVKEIKEFFAKSQTLEIPNDRDEYKSHLQVDLDIDVESELENVLTELGELFITACKEKIKTAK